MIDGILNVYKEQDYTSFDVVAKLRGILKQKKIGHTGTLDPMAEGVLLVCLGKATKLVDLLTEGDKCYRATMKLGYETDTEDVTGETIAEGDAAVLAQLTQADVKRAILSFIGKYDQIPPMYSAIKKDGKNYTNMPEPESRSNENQDRLRFMQSRTLRRKRTILTALMCIVRKARISGRCAGISEENFLVWLCCPVYTGKKCMDFL